MGKAQTVFALLIAAYGAFLLEESLSLPYFVLEVPGPGFLPLWLGVVIIGIGLALTVRGVRSWSLAAGPGEWPDALGWRRLAVATVSLVVCLLVMQFLGFFLTCLLYVVVVAFGLGIRSWRVLVTLPLAVTVALHLVFSIWLKVPLPKGILSGLIY
jgi:putative tricarboxylic transport membrane protein